MWKNEKEGLGTDKLCKYQAEGMWKPALEASISMQKARTRRTGLVYRLDAGGED